MNETLVPRDVLRAWDWGGTPSGIAPCGEGHINLTSCVHVDTPTGTVRYILQRINTSAFTDPDGLMENICSITAFLRKTIARQGGDPARGTLSVIPTKRGESYFRCGDGSAWRVFSYVDGTICLQKAESDRDFYESAVAFGTFQRELADYPARTLHETIAGFHDTPRRYRRFEAAVSADVVGRAAGAADEIAFVRARRNDCPRMTRLLEDGKLPLRVTHNDTKLNNVLFDRHTRIGVCVIDLDTVMPGLAANDFGDAVRFGANDCAEDERDLEKVNFSLPLFDTYARGYLRAAGGSLTPFEKKTLAWGARLMTLECGMRFLTDHLEGDGYFHIDRPAQNLDRARTQFKLLADMEGCWDDMLASVRRYS